MKYQTLESKLNPEKERDAIVTVDDQIIS